MKAATRLVLLSLVLMSALASHAQAQIQAPAAAAAAAAADEVVSPAYTVARQRWHGELDAFANADRAQMPAENGVLFVGSSTIRFWTHAAQAFAQLPVVINRGFGGSTMTDCALFARELVLRYKPGQVFIYAGDNDLAEGRTPLQVLEDFASFANTVRAGLPDTRIVFIAVKPSPSREKLLPQIRETNNIIAAYLNRLPNSDYVDAFTPMLTTDGRLRPELFRGDMLHLNADGYRLWESIIAPHLPGAVAEPAQAQRNSATPM